MIAGDDGTPARGLPTRGRVEGVVLVVQEGRFRLLDHEGRGYLFLLSPGAGADATALERWAADGTVVSVDYEGAPDLGAVARRVRGRAPADRGAPGRVGRTLRTVAGLTGSLASMIVRARRKRTDGASGEAPAVRELAEADTQAPDLPRRRFLSRVTLAAAGAVAAMLGVPAASIVVWPPGRQTGAPWRPVGDAAAFPAGRTVKVTYLDAKPLPWAGFAAESAAWVRREPNGDLVAFTIYCTHTGCPVRWEEQAQLFMCPCHGGAFHRDGAVAAGPPPAPLTRYPVRVNGGVVEIQPTPLPLQTSG